MKPVTLVSRFPHQITEQTVREIETIRQKADAFDRCRSELSLDFHLNCNSRIPPLHLAYIDGSPAGFLSLFQPESREAEITAVVLPEFRERGIFTALTKELTASFESPLPTLLFVTQRTNAAGTAYLSRRGLQIIRSEYLLELDRKLFRPSRNPATSTEVRTAGPDDLDILAVLSSRCFGRSAEESRSFIEKTLKAPERQQLIITCRGEPVGLGSMSTDKGITMIYGLGILPEHRRRGLGRALLDGLVEAAMPKGGPLRLEVDHTNAGALQLYEQAGFVSVSVWDYYAGSTYES